MERVSVERSLIEEKFRLHVSYNGTVVHRYIETVTLDCVFNLEAFPFDVSETYGALCLREVLRNKLASSHLCRGIIRTL